MFQTIRHAAWTMWFSFLLVLLVSSTGLTETVDLLIAYDTTAYSWVGDNGGMDAFSQDVVNRLNFAMNNSEIDLSFRLAHFMSVDYTTTADNSNYFTQDLTNLQIGKGSLKNVHSAREDYSADLVAMLIDTGSAYGYVGIGYLLTSWSGNPDYAYTVNAIRSVDISHTMTHELGHNLGAHHSKDQKYSPGPNEYLDNQYSAGWYFPGSDNRDYHTIMAYNSDGYGNYYLSAPLFSTPAVTWNGGTAGNAAHGHNARLISETRDVVAAYRNSLVQKTGSLIVTIQPEQACIAGAKWRKKGTSNWLKSGKVEKNIPAGEYTVEFLPIKSWSTPSDITVDVIGNQRTTASGSYSRCSFLPAIHILLLDDVNASNEP